MSGPDKTDKLTVPLRRDSADAVDGTVADLIHTAPVVGRVGMTVREAAALMTDREQDYLVVPLADGQHAVLTDADIRADYAKWIRPDNAKLFIVSDRPLAELTPILDSAFGQWVPPASAKAVKDFSAPIPAATPKIVLIDRPQSPQSYIMGGEVLGDRKSVV